MKKQEKFLIVEYADIRIKASDTVGLRGFFADIDREAEIVHNHTIDGSSIYRYPKVQYKTRHGHPVIVAFGEGISSIYPLIMEKTDLTIGSQIFINPEMHINLTRKEIGDSKEIHHFRFLSPWMGLNQDNYRKYIELKEEERTGFLNRIMVGNILSMCKGFDVMIENKLELTSELRPVPVHYKGEKMIGFLGEFSVNAFLPTLCGIGKGVALGYGTFVKVKNREGEDSDHE